MKRAIDLIYNLRQNFIIIGLTGRTGSGATTAADILASSSLDFEKIFKDATLPKIDQMELGIVKDFAKENWNKFYTIRVKDIITTFILEEKFDVICDYFKKRNCNIELSHAKDFFDSFREKSNEILSPIYKDEIPSSSDGKLIIKNFILDELPKFTDKLKESLNSINDYITLYQVAGDNIRRTGCAFAKDGESFEMAFSISQRINNIIKVIRRYEKANTSAIKSYFVIDAIRNPLEAYYFKERYSSFYLLSISCPDNDRINRLHAMNLTNEQIENIDKKEMARISVKDEVTDELKEKNIDFFESFEAYTTQNIKECINLSECFINNSQDKHLLINKFPYLMARKLVRFVALIQHPGLVKPTKDEFLMQMATTSAANSGCLSRNVGAIITDSNDELLTVGWNCTPKGHIPCYLRSSVELLTADDKSSYSNFEKTNSNFMHKVRDYDDSISKSDVSKRGLKSAFCFKTLYDKKNQVHTRALHAEENTILQATKHGNDTIKGGLLYTTASPCVLCAKKAYQVGVRKIVYIDPYPDISFDNILSAGDMPVEMELFSGVIKSAFHKLYFPMMPMKDELTAICTTADKKIPNSEHFSIAYNSRQFKSNPFILFKSKEGADGV